LRLCVHLWLKTPLRSIPIHSEFSRFDSTTDHTDCTDAESGPAKPQVWIKIRTIIIPGIGFIQIESREIRGKKSGGWGFGWGLCAVKVFPGPINPSSLLRQGSPGQAGFELKIRKAPAP